MYPYLLNAITARTGLLAFHGPFLLYGLADIGSDNPAYFTPGLTPGIIFCVPSLPPNRLGKLYPSPLGKRKSRWP